MTELALSEGWVDPELAAEFPELGLVHTGVEARPGRSPRVLRQRLQALADRYTGGRVIHMRQDAVPWAYRVFYRQVGIDPDTDRTPVERLALERLRHGGFESRNNVDDALTVAIAETGVPVIALDEDRIAGELGLRLARDGERLGGSGRPLSARQIVVSDAGRAVAVMVEEISEDAGVTPDSRHILLAALRVKGVPWISVEEALWLAAELMTEPD